MARDRDAQLRNLIAGYGDSIRLSDIKANIAVLFVAIMMGTVLQFHAQYPSYLNVPVILAPFIVMFLNLLASVYPRFPRDGTQAVPDLARREPSGFRVHRRSGARGGGAAGPMRAPVAHALLEERHPPGRLSDRDGHAVRWRGAPVRGLVAALTRAAPGRSPRRTHRPRGFRP